MLCISAGCSTSGHRVTLRGLPELCSCCPAALPDCSPARCTRTESVRSAVAGCYNRQPYLLKRATCSSTQGRHWTLKYTCNLGCCASYVNTQTVSLQPAGYWSRGASHRYTCGEYPKCAHHPAVYLSSVNRFLSKATDAELQAATYLWSLRST